MMTTPDFANPPIVELILGVQFSPLVKLTAGHFGLFWKELGEEWIESLDAPILDDQFEQFDRPKWSIPSGLALRLEPIRLPGRFMLGNKNGDRLIQLQPTRFHFNWRKRETVYPSYQKLIVEFERMFVHFETFALQMGLGNILLNQWELTYINSFPQTEYWQTPADWSQLIPGLFGSLFSTENMEIELENRMAEWSYELKPKRGRLHISARTGRANEDDRDSLLLRITTRGPIGRNGVATLREGLDLGHSKTVEAFLRMTSDEIKNRWR